MVQRDAPPCATGGFAVDPEAMLEHAGCLTGFGARLMATTLPGSLPRTAAGDPDTTAMICQWLALHQESLRLQGERALRRGEQVARAAGGYHETALAGAQQYRGVADGPVDGPYGV
ncbi:MAG: hypothetical protein ACRCYR_11515 [Phycicoccus sp.]